jgi:hypothetical protein
LNGVPFSTQPQNMNPQAAGKDYHSDIKNRPDVQHVRFTKFHEADKFFSCFRAIARALQIYPFSA